MSNDASLKIHGLERFVKAIDRASANQQKVFRVAMYKIGQKIESNARSNAPRGVSLQSHALKPNIVSIVKNWYTVVVGTRAVVKHAKSVEFGSKPHWPNIGDIEKWARLKLHQGSDVAFLIARKISRVGTKPQPFLIPAFKDNRNYAIRTIGGALKDFINIMKK